MPPHTAGSSSSSSLPSPPAAPPVAPVISPQCERQGVRIAGSTFSGSGSIPKNMRQLQSFKLGQADIACHVIGCHYIQENRIQSELADVASSICQDQP